MGRIVWRSNRRPGFAGGCEHCRGGLTPHSLRAYFIRRGDQHEPVRYEVDRIRNGRSFATRRVVARQAVGAILNLEASFQREEESPAVQSIAMPEVRGPDDLAETAWSDRFCRRDVPANEFDDHGRPGAGRVIRWVKLNEPLGELADPAHRRARRDIRPRVPGPGGRRPD